MIQNSCRKTAHDGFGRNMVRSLPDSGEAPVKFSDLIRNLIAIKEKYGVSESDFAEVMLFVSSLYISESIESRVNEFIDKELSLGAILSRIL